MIGYHWSPAIYRDSIKRYGLLVPLKHPRITTPTTCSEGHRNDHISLGRTPKIGWELSGGFLLRRAKELEDAGEYIPLHWHLYQVDLSGIRYQSTGRAHGELTTRTDIPKSRLTWLAERWIVD